MFRLRERASRPFLILCLLLASCSTPPPPATPTPASPPPGVTSIATPPAPIVFTYDFADKGAALGWDATNDLGQFTTAAEGLATASIGGDPYMVGPALRLDAADALHIEIRMRHDRGSDAQLFWERAGQSFNEADSQHFETVPDGEWHDYRITLKDHAGWQGSIVRLRLDPTTQQGANVTIAHIRGLGPLPAALEIASFGASVAFPRAGEPFTVQAIAVNRGDQPADSAGLQLDAPDGVTVTGDATTTFAAVQPSATITGTWTVSAAAGAHTLGLSVDGQRLVQALVIAEDPTGAELALSGDDVRLRFTDHSFGYGPATLEWRSGDDWLVAGRLRSFGTLNYLADDGMERQAAFFAPEMAADPASQWLEADARHTDGALTWRLTARFERSDAGPWLTAAYTLTANQPAQLLAWTGPELYVGEGQADYRRDSALFPGLEFLTGDEMSSGTDYVDASAAARYVPHPNKITIPLMAVTGNGAAAGLMWDPLQAWDAAGHDRPAALFASPNRWEGQANHLMRLFVPGMTAGLPENAGQLDRPYDLAAGQALHLSARLFAAPSAEPAGSIAELAGSADILAPLDIWAAANPLPVVQPRPRSDAGSLQLALENYTTVTWVPDARGWRYAIHDPWGPGSNPAIALHLWLSTLAEPQSEALAARRDMALSSAGSPPVGGQPNPWFYRPLWLLHTGGHAAEMQQALRAALDIAARQQSDGSWPYTPNPAAQRAFGKAGDSSNGWVATSALPVLYMARLTGHPALVAAGQRALAYLEASPLRPEGAQTWELSLHVPDLLASAWAVQSFVEGYRLTGELRYLDLAERWAVAGLPFVYLWNAPDRPIMRYTTIPVYGASNYIYPWFGRPVQWNGLDYAYGLQALAAELRATGRTAQLDWRQVAEGITVATAQMQPESGPYLGMYPDAWDVVAGTEAYTWWLAPTYLAHNLLLLGGEPAAQVHTAMVDLGGQRIHVNAPGEIVSATGDAGRLTVRVRYLAGESAALMFSPLAAAAARVTVDGREAGPATAKDSTDTAGIAAAAAAPSWTHAGGLLLVHVPFGSSGEAEVQVELAR
jgi:hypothetical protein